MSRDDAQARFLTLVKEAIDGRRLRRLLLSKPAHRVLAPGFADEGPVLQRVVVKPVRTGEGVKLGFTWHYDTRDQNACLSPADALKQIESLLRDLMQSALLDGGTVEAELGYSKRGRPLFRSRRLSQEGAANARPKGAAQRVATNDSVAPVPLQAPAPAGPGDTKASATASGRERDAAHDTAGGAKPPARHGQPVSGLTMLRPQGAGAVAAASATSAMNDAPASSLAPDDADDDDWLGVEEHNRRKHHLIPMNRPFLKDLGIVLPSGALVPAMSRKWRQINRFVEIVATAWQNNPASATRGRGKFPIRIHDYGAGKGYLTFALHDHLSNTLGLTVETVGIERRSDLVGLCNDIARRRGMSSLRFVQGDIASASVGDADIVIALHACDTATDDALHRGIRAGAAMLVCSPCCHRELRPQLLSPHPLRPLLRHGIHLGQEAEMLTDGLRALLLEAEGYEAQVFEFISLEHTSKNKMILGNRTGKRRPQDSVWSEIDELKKFYGIGSQRLDRLLRDGARESASPAVR